MHRATGTHAAQPFFTAAAGSNTGLQEPLLRCVSTGRDCNSVHRTQNDRDSRCAAPLLHSGCRICNQLTKTPVGCNSVHRTQNDRDSRCAAPLLHSGGRF